MDIFPGYWIYVNLSLSLSLYIYIHPVVNILRNQLFFGDLRQFTLFSHPVVQGFRLPALLWSYPRRQRQRALGTADEEIQLTVQCPVNLHGRNETKITTQNEKNTWFFGGVNKLIGCLNFGKFPRFHPFWVWKYGNFHGIWKGDGRIFAIHFGGAPIVGNNQA